MNRIELCNYVRVKMQLHLDNKQIGNKIIINEQWTIHETINQAIRHSHTPLETFRFSIYMSLKQRDIANPSLISLMASVAVKRHVYFLIRWQ